MSVIKSITSPMKFLIQANLLSQLGEYLKPYGKAGLLVCDPFILQKAQQDTEATFKEHNIQAVFSKFSGETTDDEINRLRAIMDDNNAEFVVGLGGGKTLDTAKAVAYYQKVPVIIIRCRKPATSGGGYKAIVKCDEFCYTHLTIFNVLHSTVKLRLNCEYAVT